MQFRVRKRYKDVMLMLGFNYMIDQLVMANSVCWYGHVLRKEDAHVFKRGLHFEVEGRRMKWWPKNTRKKQVEEEGIVVYSSIEDALCRRKWIVGVNHIAIRLRLTRHIVLFVHSICSML